MAENTLLLLTPDQVDWVAEKVDQVIKADGIVEALDKPAAKLFIGLANKYVSLYVPDEYKDEIQAVLTDVMEANYPEAITDAAQAIEAIIQNIEKIKPGVKEIIISLLNLIAAALATMVVKE